MLPLIKIMLAALLQIITLLLQLGDFLILDSMFANTPETIDDVFYLHIIVNHASCYVNKRLLSFPQQSSMVRFLPLDPGLPVQYIASVEILLNGSLLYHHRR